MSDRITDERMEEVWEWFCEWASQGPYEDHFNEIFQALKVERKENQQLKEQLDKALLLADRRIAYLQTHVWKSGKAL